MACTACLLLSCADAARYVVVTDATPFQPREAVEHRLIYVSEPDARASAGLVGLRATSSVRQYGGARRGDLGAVEALLFETVSGAYGAAEDTLRAREAEIPVYLWRLLAADLASERSRTDLPAAELLGLYQKAYDVQQSDLARTIVKLRVRQLRYGR
ncbi:MAG TPA: hypothetical protein VF841_11475 [Anaeromyxobacter sp.]